MANTDDHIGKPIGNYIVGKWLASGQFGSVYYGKHQILDRQVAVKLLHTIYLRSPEERESFLQEAQLLEKLEHPHCLRVYDVGITDNNTPYIISQYASKGSLHDQLEHRQGPLPLNEVLRILSQVGQALQHAHERHIIHRDLKPENILFDQNDAVLLADFGLAVVIHAASVLQVNTAGTPEYMSPEQFRGEASKKSDQYALGCMTYELVTGHLPFEATGPASLGYLHTKETPISPSAYNTSLPPHIEHAILKAMAKAREDRYPSIADFITALNSPTPQSRQDESAVTLDTTKSSPATQLIHEGDNHFQQKRYKEALPLYQQALRLDPHNIIALKNKAATLMELKRYEEALAIYEQMTQLDTYTLYAHLNKGKALYRLKRYQDALLAYNQAIHINPKEPEAHLGKCKAFLALRRYDGALVACNNLIQLNPHFAIAYDKKAEACIGLQQYEEALDACEKALHYDHNLAAAYHNKGFTLWHLQRYQEALIAYNYALRLDPNDITTTTNKGSILIKLQRYQEALEVAKQLLHLDPQHTLAYIIESSALRGLQQYKAALVACDQALLLEPDLALAYVRKGEVLTDLGRIAEAQRAYQKARDLGIHDI